jgi:hypothetical protein
VEVYLDGLGLFENGKTHEISDEQAQEFRVAHRTYKETTDPDTGMVTSVEESEGPTVLEYFRSSEGISVSKLKAARNKDTSNTSQTVPSGGTVDEDDEPEGLTDGGPQSLGTADPRPVVPVTEDPADGSVKEGE